MPNVQFSEKKLLKLTFGQQPLPPDFKEGVPNSKTLYGH